MEILTTVTLLGKARLPGDALTDDELERIPDKTRQALISQGVIGEKAKLKANEKKAITIRGEAAELVAEAERTVAEMQANLDKVLAEQERLLEARRPLTVPLHKHAF